MPTQNPQVSVFHFTSRISSAKIRKYKLATERGMSGGGGNVIRAESPVGDLKATPSPSLEPASMEPPAKRPKLKLNVRRPSGSPDTIAVSQPKRENSLRIRYSADMVLDGKDLEEVEDGFRQIKSRASPAESSDLSSLTSVHSNEKEPTPAQAPERPSTKQRDYSRDFMSYYVTGVEDEDEEDVAPDPVEVPIPRKPDPPKQVATTEPSMPVQATKRPKPRQQRPYQPRADHQTPTYPTARLQPPQPPVPRQSVPQPTVVVIDPTTKPDESQGPDTVASMIAKLDTLSNALTSFGGIPATPRSPDINSTDHDQPQPSEEKKDVDDFLAMFDDDDAEDKNTKPSATGRDLNVQLDKAGEMDSALTYGIKFIQNALRSWAVQRTMGQWQQHNQHYQQARNEPQQQKRGPGRPRKFDNGDEEPRPPPPPSHVKIELAKTPEGAAIVAFQHVLDSGCLKVNAQLPIPLSRALRRLYMQIDQLINQGSRKEAPWQCMSYGAQIAAQKTRVEKWKIAHAKAQQEMIRQQHIAQQQVMQQMGIPAHQQFMTPEQMQQQHAMDLERKRSLQHAAQQPHLHQYLANPLRMDGKSTNSSATQDSAQSSVRNTSASVPAHDPSINSPVTGAAEHQGKIPHGLPTQSSPDGKGVHLDKIKLYMPNFLPRSGQSMKFSFAPHSEAAVKAFGPQAFPTEHSGPNLPNRGPMKINPSVPSNHAHGLSGSGLSRPVIPSNMPKPSEPKSDDVIIVDWMPSNRASSASRGPTENLPTASVNGWARSPQTTANTSGFTAVNASATDARSSSALAAPHNAGPSVIPLQAPEANAVSNSLPGASDVNDASILDKRKASAFSSTHSHPEAMLVDQ